MATTPTIPIRSDQAMRQPPRVSKWSEQLGERHNYRTRRRRAKGRLGREFAILARRENQARREGTAPLSRPSLPLHLAELEAVVMGRERLGRGGAGRHAQLQPGRQLQVQG